MRTGFREHLIASTIILLFFVLHSGAEFLAVMFFLIGAVAPDIDSPVSKPRKFARKLVLVLALFLILLLYPQLSAVCESFMDKYSCVYLPLLGVLLAFAAVCLLDLIIPKHRGFLHTLSAAVLYGLVVGVVVHQLGAPDSFRAGVFAFLGYVSHLLVDFVGDAVPF